MGDGCGLDAVVLKLDGLAVWDSRAMPALAARSLAAPRAYNPAHR
jgi:hypothetical protein